ncbi:MAG: glutamine synthetase [Sulfitobacter sp.]
MPDHAFELFELPARMSLCLQMCRDEYVQATDYREQVREVARRLELDRISHVYIQFVTLTGKRLGKCIPAERWSSFYENGAAMMAAALADAAMSHRDDFIGYKPNAADFIMLPDPESFQVLPWDPNRAQVFCRLFESGCGKTASLLDSDCRSQLGKRHSTFQEQHGGLGMHLGVEPELIWLQGAGSSSLSPIGNGKATPYRIGTLDQLGPIVFQVSEYCKQMGLKIHDILMEDAPGQTEFNFDYGSVETSADNLLIFRQICHRVARDNGFVACFMPKPWMFESASGCHFNISLYCPGKAQNTSVKTNMFLPEGRGAIQSDFADRCIAAVLAHAPALTALAAPTVNSYRRLREIGYLAPSAADWGYQNRTCAVRVPALGRIEYRVPDSMVNPYLMSSALLNCMEVGIVDGIPLPPEEQRLSYRHHKNAAMLPQSLHEALVALRLNQVVRQALPGDAFRLFDELKSDEWDSFLSTVSDWDVKAYSETE